MSGLDKEAHGQSQALLCPEATQSSTRKYMSVASVTLWLLILAVSLAVITTSDKRSGFLSLLDSRPQREIVLFGDSLIGVSDSTYGLSEELQHAVQDEKTNVEVFIHASAKGGDTATTLSARLDSDVLARHGQAPPDGVIILFDSDAADEDNAAESWYKDEYKIKLKGMISKILEKVHYVALSGPILFGELPEGENYKDDLLDEYEQMNKEIAEEYNIDFIELRHMFYRNEPTSGDSVEMKSGKLTRDGEHPLRKGYEIIKSQFLKTILSSNWVGMFRLAPGERADAKSKAK